MGGLKHLNLHGKKSLLNSQRDQRPSFQNGLEFVQVKRWETQKHQKVRKKQKRKKIMTRKKRRRRRRKKRRNKLIFQFMPRLKSNPCNFTHSKIESLLLYQRLVDFTHRVIFTCFVPNCINLLSQFYDPCIIVFVHK